MLCCAFFLPSSCHKECFIPRYWFEIPFTVSLTAESIHPGDTLWLESEYDFKLENLHTHQLIEVGDFNMGTQLLLAGILDTLVHGSFGDPVNFAFMTTQGETDFVSSYYSVTYDSNSTMNRFRGGLIIKHPGIYWFNFYSEYYKYTIYDTDPWSINYFSREVTFKGAACANTLYLTYRMSSDVEDNNFKLYNISPEAPDYQARLNDFNNRGGFIVKVEL